MGEGERTRAAELARRHIDINTVTRALDSADPRLHLWGLWFWRGGAHRAVRDAERVPLQFPTANLTREEEAWRALTPRIKVLAKESPYRHIAIDGLAGLAWTENVEFLRSLIPGETSAGMILQLLERTVVRRGLDYTERDKLFNEQLLRLLSDTDRKVRQGALANIAMNWNNAEMYQVRFTAAVSQRVEELRNAEDTEDRRLANWAAEGLEKMSGVWAERDRLFDR